MRICSVWKKAALVRQAVDEGVICTVAISRTRLRRITSRIANLDPIDFDLDSIQDPAPEPG
jgi:hypothetical protein